MKQNFLLSLYQSSQTVFTLAELTLLFPELSFIGIKNRVHHAVRVGKLKLLRRGIYAKDGYDPYEVANKLYSPSYISLETVLQKEGIIFQVYDTIFVIGSLSRRVSADGHAFYYRKVAPHILADTRGVKQNVYYAIATKERAFLDAVYLYKDYHFDHVNPLNWDLVNEIKSVYKSKALEKRVEQYYLDYTRTYV